MPKMKVNEGAQLEAEKKEEEAKKKAEIEETIAEKKRCQIKESVLDEIQNKIDNVVLI